MMTPNRPILLALLACSVALAGCSSKPATTHPATAATAPHGTAATPTAPATGVTRPKATTAARPGGKQLPDSTGIPACDDYLASYVACHRVAAIYTPDQVEPRYEQMRTSLITDSLDPNIRPQLGARCTSLAQQLRQALHGKSCDSATPAPATSSR